MPPPMILSLSLSLSLLPMPMPMLLLLLLVQVLMLVLVLVLVLVPGWAGPSRVGVATAAALAAATIRSPPRHPRGESVLYYKS
ncbi:Uncharacterised protein [Burkholderia pseudomallei]|nr:hypothetical protein AQ709_04635 [Burkholderia pseudomallei]OMQ75488.1 hypothetical protein AQ711_02195 [Burkholderia pseudomallei]OMQ80624.1 hypothetical protein AQ712_17190 [Burkholderia pseudomallei]OMQ85684.1 hypothetical protein AQ716_09725 [Burkholderia pseudomallei]OMQ90079.1 hypothetical protein AQ714_21400 [Burkholderia pseudomallei]